MTRRRSATHEPKRARRSRAGFEYMTEGPPPGLVRRAMTANRHLLGLLLGGVGAWVQARRAEHRTKGPRFLIASIVTALARPFLRKDLAERSFAFQLRRRLELLGPTYIKLGQILSLREDILPRNVTDELKRLLSELPAVPFPTFLELIVRDLGRPVEEMFAWVDPVPVGSASIAQIHRATTVEGDSVVIKVVKPGIRETLARDALLLRILGRALHLVFPRYQPRRIINEFVDYTLREVDMRREADNARTFAANFRDTPDIVFPAVYPEYSGSSVLCMEYFDGLRPDAPEAQALPADARERLVDLGAEAIIRMIYQDGFFHADLHPGNLVILPDTKVGFIDLGMVGRLDGELKRTLLYYYYSLVTGDAENAARYLTAVAQPGRGADPAGFRREVIEISARWRRAATFEGFSLAQLFLESLSRSARFGMYFPVELVLMVKALITYEGVGHILLPGLDVAAVSRRHIRSVFIRQFSPVRILEEELRGAPDLVDALIKMPMLVTEGLRVLERSTRRPRESPFAGLRGTLIAGFCLVAGAVLIAAGGPWPAGAALFAIAFLLAIRRGA